MTNPGEVNQRIGRIYQRVFIGALEANIRPFEAKFEVETEPEKTSFVGRGGRSFSFDFSGVYNDFTGSKEVFGECKGYAKAGSLLIEYRLFLAKSYVTAVDNKRHQSDFFWFVTNVPFACGEGGGVRGVEFVHNALTSPANPDIQEVLGKGKIDESFVERLAQNLGVFILTDSFLQNTIIRYKVKRGETIWSILRGLHGTNERYPFRAYATEIAHMNRLQSPDKIIANQRISLRWQGLKSPSPSGLPAY
jgi:hypothetical protein